MNIASVVDLPVEKPNRSDNIILSFGRIKTNHEHTFPGLHVKTSEGEALIQKQCDRNTKAEYSTPPKRQHQWTTLHTIATPVRDML